MNANKNGTQSARSLTVTLAIAFFTLSVVSLLVIGSLAIFANYRSLQRETAAELELIALNASKTVAGSIQEKFSILETAVDISNPVTADPTTRRELLGSLPGLEPAFRQTALLNETGRPMAGGSRLSSSLSPQFEEKLQEETLVSLPRAGQRYISPVYFDDLTSEPLTVIAVPVQDIFGDFQGVLAAELNLKFMWDLVDQLLVGETGYVYVVDNQGALIAFRDTSRVLRGENVGQIFEVSEFVKNPTAATDVTQEVESYPGLLGESVVGTYVPLGAPQWAVLTELPTAEANRGIVTFFIASIAAILGFAVLSGAAGVVLARNLAAPLVHLSQVATQLADGDLTAEAEVSGATEIAQVASTFNTMALRLRDLIGSLEQRVTERTKDLATVAEVGTAIATILETDRLLQAVVELTKDRFNLYHSHIYLLDESGENLVLAAGAGEPGRQMKDQGLFIPLDREQSLVARAAREHQGVTVNDVTKAPDFLPNPLLPDTRSELAVPMIVGGNLIGVFDVQSDQVGRFTNSDISIQTTLAAQVATSIQNVRSFEQAKSQADLESLSSAIGQKIQRTTSVEEAMQTAIREVGLALGATRVSANIGTNRQPDGDETSLN
ncbi:MAG: GAF domain-containing protein [Anaerolineae bacterium]|nr:GAF domain-containing protein [Anaerolineae bacterium]